MPFGCNTTKPEASILPNAPDYAPLSLGVGWLHFGHHDGYFMSNLDISKKIKGILQEKKTVTWLLLDEDCHLRVRIDPSKCTSTYYFRVRYPKQICRCIGPTDRITISEARKIAFDLTTKVDAGYALPLSKTRKPLQDPSFCHKKKEQLSLGSLLRSWRDAEMQKDPPRWAPTDKKAAVKINGIIKNHVDPVFGQIPFTEITAQEIAEYLTTLFKKHSSYATSLRCWIKSAYMYAERHHLCEDGYHRMNMLDLLLNDARWRRRGPKAHQPSLPYEHIPEFMAELHEIGGTTARCLEVAILTCSRVGSVTQMRWADVDFSKKVWVCPRDTMKISDNGDHIVYLSDEVLRILSCMPRLLPRGREAVWVFSTARGDRICNALTKTISTINTHRQKRGLPIWIDPEQSRLRGKPTPPTVHGFRASFKTWSRSERLGNWKKYSDVAVERCLHHYITDKYGGAYDREDFPTMQRQILEDWSQYCTSYVPLKMA